MHQVSTLGLLLSKICYNIRLLQAATGGILQKKVVFKNFTKLTGKQLCWCLLFNKVEGRGTVSEVFNITA